MLRNRLVKTRAEHGVHGVAHVSLFPQTLRRPMLLGMLAVVIVFFCIDLLRELKNGVVRHVELRRHRDDVRGARRTSTATATGEEHR